jgi:uncharacterized protein (DUF1330 family)
MANAYLVGIYNKIIDQEKLQKYAVDALPAMMANGGKKALARSANITQIEGIPPERAVILEFELVKSILAIVLYLIFHILRIHRNRNHRSLHDGD